MVDPIRWFIADIADAISDGLRAHAAAQDAEQTVHGFDLDDEVDLHPLLADAIAQAGFGVEREQRYPSDRGKRKRSEGKRCDLVLTPEGRSLAEPDRDDTLFAPTDAVPLEEAFWLEVKTVSQFRETGANSTYASQLLSTVKQDITKLSRDDDVRHGGLLLLLFVADADIAHHDLRVWQDRCIERGLPIGAPSERHIQLTNRHGHGTCFLALYPVHKL
ncbi:MAG: hypothetical protein AAF432_02285 [Planctomycetota bacterium]